MGKQELPRARRTDYIYHVWVCFLPVFLTACSGSLGKIQLEDVNAVITESETAIEHARLANAQDLASDTFQQAENSLVGAKVAAGVKDGLGAMKLAYHALTQAQIAEQEALYKSQGNGLNAIIKRKEADLTALQTNLKKADRALEKSRTDLQQLDMQKNRLQADMDQKLQETEQARREILHDYSKTKTEHADLQSKLDTIQTQFIQARDRVEAHERQIHQLRRELADAQSLVEKTHKAAAEARTKAVTQAQNYSKHIEQLDQSNVLKQREAKLARKRQEARAYVQQQRGKQPVRTNSTSLTSKQIDSARAALRDWAIIWSEKNIERLLSRYTQDAMLDQTVIRSSNEKQTHLNRQQMVYALKKMTNSGWQETGSEFDADGESIIGTYRFNRLSQNDMSEETPALHDVWTREVWMRQVGTEWKIFRESWRIYEAVPRYNTAFN